MDEKKALVPTGRTDLIPETQNMVTLAQYLNESKMFPNAGGVAGIMTIMEYGRELGIPPVAALSTMQNIRGRLTMEAKAMLAVAQKNAGVTWKIDALNAEECTMTFMREGFSPCTVTFTFEEAKLAGLNTKDSWRLYRQDMLFARCASRGVRRIAPDAVLGLYSTEEMRDVDATAKKDMEGGARPLSAEEEPDEDFPPREGEQDVPGSDDEGRDNEPPVGDDEPADYPGDGKEGFDEPGTVKPPPAEAKDPILEGYVNDIKRSIEERKIAAGEFKKWLVGQGKKMNRKFVGYIGSNLSFHKGDTADLRYLITVLPKAIALYEAEKKA